MCPDVETLARWLANEEWMPNPSVGGSTRTSPADAALAERIWEQLPFGLRAWCLRHEAGMWKGGELLSALESAVEACRMPAELAARHARHAGMPRCACHMPAEWAASGSRHDGLPTADSVSGGPASDEPRGSYWGHGCMLWRHMVVEKMVEHGMQHDDCSFVLDDMLGFEPGFGKCDYAWDADRPKMRWMLSVADKFISLMMGSERPACLIWDPICRVMEPTDWKAGGVHEPEAVRAWESLHEVSSWVIDWVKNGFYVEPEGQVPHSEVRNASFLDPRSADFDGDMFAFAEQKLKKDEGLGVIRRLGPTARPDNVNRISLAPKNSETEPWRLVGDIRRPNRSYGKKKVRFETLRHVSEVFEPHDWLWLADLKAAYHSIFVQERLARQLGFKWKGIYYKWLSLPFGFVHSPYCFQRLMRQVVKHCRWLRRKILQFLDDGMGGHSSFVEAVRERNRFYNLLHGLGFRLSVKSSPLPEQTKVFLGMVVHTGGPVCTFHVPSDKIEKLQALMAEATGDLSTWTMRKLAKITGKLLSMSLAVPMTRLMSRSLYECMHANSEQAWDDLIGASVEAEREMRWMIGAIVPFNASGFPIWVRSEVADYDITADASPVAGGFIIAEAVENRIRMMATVLFRPEESELAQCHRELWIVCLLVRGLAFQLSGKKIRIRVDAKSTELYWKNGGGRSPILTRMTKLLWATCVAHRITIVDIVHIAGTRMVEEGVDSLSRPKAAAFGSERDRQEWSLTGEVVRLLQVWVGGPFSMDRFASRTNKKCARYTAAQWEPEAVAPPSAFAEQHDWRLQPSGEWEWNLCFPPHRLIAECLARAERDRAWMCMIVPNWPSQTWWPSLCRHATAWNVLGRERVLHRLENGKPVPVRRAPVELVAVVVDCR